MSYIGIEPLQIARVSAALAAAGAWDVPVTLICAQARTVTLHFNYTRGAAGGAFDWQIQVSPYSIAALVPVGGAEWTTMSLYESGGVLAGADSQSLIAREYINYGSTSAAAEGIIYGPINLVGFIERFRFRARESGVTATPGTLQVEAVFE